MAETLEITATGNKVLTEHARFKWEAVQFKFEEEAAPVDYTDRTERALRAKGIDLDKRTRGDKADGEVSAVQRRQEHQMELAKQLEEEARQRLEHGDVGMEEVSFANSLACLLACLLGQAIH